MGSTMNMACSVQQPSQGLVPVIAELESRMCCLWAMATLETWTEARDMTQEHEQLPSLTGSAAAGDGPGSTSRLGRF